MWTEFVSGQGRGWALVVTNELSIYGSTALCRALAAFQFTDLFTQSVELFRRGISPSQGRYLHSTTQTQNKRIQISMH
jgi:hypothetical protein